VQLYPTSAVFHPLTLPTPSPLSHEQPHFEKVLDAGELLFPNCFDVVFCLGVLYHTTDPIGMLRVLWKSMKPNGTLIIDCQGIDYGYETSTTNNNAAAEASDDTSSPKQLPLALMPRKTYANAGGIWFLPNQELLRIWLTRANFKNIEMFYDDKLSTDEQRSTEWADISSLQQALNQNDQSRTVEGYPAPYRFYMRAQRA
jgi:tRNA (mo5U34)-methyltransferase